ncbi:hypothetical protein SESBI_37274 [Sesbania bispinosa]|nr:hypothetical protein SESBI_37274 [Sesbania bispinosa]
MRIPNAFSSLVSPRSFMFLVNLMCTVNPKFILHDFETVTELCTAMRISHVLMSSTKLCAGDEDRARQPRRPWPAVTAMGESPRRQ